jgi:hypothetical protein
VAREELDFAPVGETVLDLDYIVNTAHGTIHCAKSYRTVEIPMGPSGAVWGGFKTVVRSSLFVK